MKRAAYMGGCLVATILAILVCLSASPAAAHSAHRHTSAAASIPASTENDSYANATIRVAAVIAIQAPAAQGQDSKPCDAPCCAGHGCCCGPVTLEDRAFAITLHAFRELRRSHDRSLPSRAEDAPSEPPKTFQ